MKLQYDVPEHLASYLEFIPEDMLPDFITKAIEKAIEERSLDEVQRKPESTTMDYSELLDKLTEMFSSNKISLPTSPQKESPLETPTYTFDVVTEENSDDSVEDNSLVDDFLLDICK